LKKVEASGYDASIKKPEIKSETDIFEVYIQTRAKLILRLPPAIKQFNPITGKQVEIVRVPIFMEVPQLFVKVVPS